MLGKLQVEDMMTKVKKNVKIAYLVEALGPLACLVAALCLLA